MRKPSAMLIRVEIIKYWHLYPELNNTLMLYGFSSFDDSRLDFVGAAFAFVENISEREKSPSPLGK